MTDATPRHLSEKSTRPAFATLVCALFVCQITQAATDPRPSVPDAKTSRPAGPILPPYPHESFRFERMGEGGRSYWLFEPTGPTPAIAPVVVFNHGWLAVNPGVYGSWIEHLTRRGFVVIFPRYQETWLTDPADFLPNAAAATLDALDVLATAPGRVRPDLSRFALIGHSAGGNLAALLAAAAEGYGLPEPKAVVSLMPGEVLHLVEPCASAIPARTLLVVVAGDQDRIVGDGRARELYNEATAVPESRKEFVLYRTDRRGPVPLIADHLAPTAGLASIDSGEGPLRSLQMTRAGVDLLDRHGFWRLADITLDAGFAGKSLDDATAEGYVFHDLGRWSDGRPVTPPLTGDDLAAIPALFPPHGVRIVPWRPIKLPRLTLSKP